MEVVMSGLKVYVFLNKTTDINAKDFNMITNKKKEAKAMLKSISCDY